MCPHGRITKELVIGSMDLLGLFQLVLQEDVLKSLKRYCRYIMFRVKTWFGIAGSFVGLFEGMAKYGFLVLSSALAAFVFRLQILNFLGHLDGTPDL